jgi:penicillin-binding protein 2
VLVCFTLLGLRLFYLQIVRHDHFEEQAENNRTAVVPIVPNRGLITDRHGVVLATNYSAYTLEIAPSKVTNLDETIDALAQVVEVTQRDRRRFKRLREEFKSFESLPIRTKLTDEEVARFAAQRYRFPGVDIRARLFRSYPYGDLASHVVGYIGRINPREKERIEEEDDEGNYRGTEYIGKLGVEQSYEKQLHGITGFEQVETSAGGRAVRRLSSSPATPWRTGGAQPQDRRGAGLCEQAHVRSQPLRRRHRRGKLDHTERVHRQAPAQPGPARHLPAWLDLQALHGDGGARIRQAPGRSGDQ